MAVFELEPDVASDVAPKPIIPDGTQVVVRCAGEGTKKPADPVKGTSNISIPFAVVQGPAENIGDWIWIQLVFPDVAARAFYAGKEAAGADADKDTIGQIASAYRNKPVKDIPKSKGYSFICELYYNFCLSVGQPKDSLNTAAMVDCQYNAVVGVNEWQGVKSNTIKTIKKI